MKITVKVDVPEMCYKYGKQCDHFDDETEQCSLFNKNLSDVERGIWMPCAECIAARKEAAK